MSPLPKEKIPTDFLSGDFGWYGSMPVGQFEARFFAGTGKPWDLMLWGWIGVPAIGALYKSPRQLCQESATVLAQGGGLEVYYQPDRDGDFSKFHLNCMNVLGQFARKRKKLCWKSETVPQVASLIDTRSFWSKSPAILNSWNGEYRPFMGALNATISAGHSVDILTDVQLASRLKDYPVLMITEWEQFAPGTVRQIQSYVHDGGNLLLMGAGTSRIFADLLDVEFQNDPREGTFLVQVPKDSRGRTFSHLTSITGPWQDITPGKKIKVLAHRTDKPHEGRNPQPVATVNRCGKGQVACFYGALGKGLYLSHAPGLREIIAVMLDALYTPLARIKNDDCGEIELALRRQKGQILIHLINANNMCTSECVTGPDGNALTNAGNYPLVDRIPAIGPITIQLQLPHKPRSIRLEPEGIKLPVKSVGKNRYEVTLPKLDIHAIITID
ncbi:hypothetical protein QQ054_04650 [Oscillatoria amoena NRMC-F 0135]|nr:hypothetical protein [Oscillatoria amoena NRMC-F 0135]